MHKATIKTKRGYEPIYFSYSRHSDSLKVTAFCIGDSGADVLYVKDSAIIEIIPDPSLKNAYGLSSEI